MTDFFQLFVDYCTSIFASLDSVVFSMYGISVTPLSVIFCLLIVAFVISVFWKGAKK